MQNSNACQTSINNVGLESLKQKEKNSNIPYIIVIFHSRHAEACNSGLYNMLGSTEKMMTDVKLYSEAQPKARSRMQNQ